MYLNYLIIKFIFIVYDICGNFESLPDHRVPDNEINMIYYFLKTVGIVHQVKVLTHNITFTSYESRYRTFDNSRTRINSDIDTLCKAGYYSTGKLYCIIYNFN